MSANLVTHRCPSAAATSCHRGTCQPRLRAHLALAAASPRPAVAKGLVLPLEQAQHVRLPHTNTLCCHDIQLGTSLSASALSSHAPQGLCAPTHNKLRARVQSILSLRPSAPIIQSLDSARNGLSCWCAHAMPLTTRQITGHADGAERNASLAQCTLAGTGARLGLLTPGVGQKRRLSVPNPAGMEDPRLGMR